MTSAIAPEAPRFGHQLLWVTGAFLLAFLPHVHDLRIWIVLIALIAIGVRLAIEQRQWKLPPRILRVTLAFGAMLGVLASYRTLNGLEAGTALLVLMGAMKLFETSNRRDLTIVIFVSYFLLFAGFLYNQSLLRLPWTLVAAWLLTVTLMRTHQTTPMDIRDALRTTGKMLLQSLPLALALFLFFPRLPGQFWAVPGRDAATTGIDDEMSPGDVSDLSLSSAVAFRVRFDGEMPPPKERYWRGPVLQDFDGRTWRRGPMFLPEQPFTANGPSYRYTLTMEPSNREWVFALDSVTEWPRRRTYRMFDQQLLARAPLSTLSPFDLQSSTSITYTTSLSNTGRTAATRLNERNPRSRALAQEIFTRTGGAEAFTAAVLQKFREEEYFYTLEPPRLEADSVDDFLFTTRRGFCEHFASAFTMMARAAGIPARVVLGYQGGEFNRMGGYLIVTQAEAHAWAEIWIEGKGWTRVDPTAAVAPERIERGIDAALAEDEPVPGRVLRRFDTLAQLRLAWDAVNTFWNDQVIGFGESQQRSILERLGIEDASWEALGLALVISMATFFALLTGWLAWRYRPRQRDPVVQTYAQLCQRFASANLARADHEGPDDYLTRVVRARPDLASQLDEIRSLYIALRYGPAPLAGQLSRLKFLIGQLKV